MSTVIENDRKMLCELQGYYDDAYEQVYSKLMTDPIPELPKKKNNRVKTLIPTKKTAYNLFVANFDGVVEEGQNKMTVAAAKWKELTEDEKKPYEEMSYKTSEEFEKFKGFVEENESKIREEIKEELENEKDTKKHKKMIHRVAAKMWVDGN